MPPVSDLQKEDARRIAPPAAHRAGTLLDDAGPLVSEIEQLQAQLQDRIKTSPHDKTEILRLVDTFKKKAMALFGHAADASRTIKDGR